MLELSLIPVILWHLTAHQVRGEPVELLVVIDVPELCTGVRTITITITITLPETGLTAGLLIFWNQSLQRILD